MEHLSSSPSLAAPLQVILNAELAAGNEIAEASAWPPKCELLIILREPFHRPYATSGGVEFVEINDGHYWKSEYRYNNGMHTLACRF
jgi:hypothetical protein